MASLSSVHIMNKWTITDNVRESNAEQFAIRPLQFCADPKTAFKNSHYQYAAWLFLNCEAVTKPALKISLPCPAGNLQCTQALNTIVKSIFALALSFPSHESLISPDWDAHSSTQQPADPPQRWSKTTLRGRSEGLKISQNLSLSLRQLSIPFIYLLIKII